MLVVQAGSRYTGCTVHTPRHGLSDVSSTLCVKCGCICPVSSFRPDFDPLVPWTNRHIAALDSIGNLLGEGKARRAEVVAKLSTAVAALIGCIWWYVFL